MNKKLSLKELYKLAKGQDVDCCDKETDKKGCCSKEVVSDTDNKKNQGCCQ